jgi:hypothetical protein
MARPNFSFICKSKTTSNYLFDLFIVNRDI